MSRAKPCFIHYIVPFAVLAAPAPLASAYSATSESVDLAAVYADAVDAMNRGNVDEASSLFAEDALYEGGAACTPYCRGRDALRRELQTQVDDHVEITPTNVRLSKTSAERRVGLIQLRLAGLDSLQILGGDLFGSRLGEHQRGVGLVDTGSGRIALHPRAGRCDANRVAVRFGRGNILGRLVNLRLLHPG